MSPALGSNARQSPDQPQLDLRITGESQPMPDWEEEPTVHRLHRCRKTLFVHGFLTETENRKVRERLPKEVVTK